MALGNSSIDPASFTLLRVLSGAGVLVLISSLSGHKRQSFLSPDWPSAAMLFLYAAAFSIAYVSLSTGTGALILFGAVQSTMMLGAIRTGERPSTLVWIGLLVALAGLVYLVSPGLTAPPMIGSLLMAIAGVAWGVYSLRGRRTGRNPLVDTTRNFIGALPMVALVSVAGISKVHLTGNGLILAVISGGIASGVGYVIWYKALQGLTATRAATVQLSVPVLTAYGGTMVLSEEVTLRLVLSAILILGGIALSLIKR